MSLGDGGAIGVAGLCMLRRGVVFYRSNQGTAYSRRSCTKEGDECQSASNRMEDHHASEALACVDLSAIEVGIINVLQERCRVVSDVLSGAVVSTITSNSTVTKCAHGNVGVVSVGPICQLHVHDSNMIHNRARDGGDYKQNGANEEQESTNMVEEASLRHLGQ
ncbi:hypothetical protein M7I_0461 [Glarea lozoyensis 74030]|uniref:Uncharacterized protein n=1 Tax=Glarea lozoyensis (strain ATCC 74030 / MF5533) TaxID=1104152 RepID=H0EDF2_GLAL7|nr:hypothetical protein M7I_0461 [Glarea lozoyensis 74030]